MINDETPGKKEYTNLAGHFLRGHAGSIAYTLAMECGATWAKTLCIERVRHTITSFMKNYCRGIPIGSASVEGSIPATPKKVTVTI